VLVLVLDAPSEAVRGRLAAADVHVEALRHAARRAAG